MTWFNEILDDGQCECFFKSAFVQTQLTIRFLQSYEIGERCDCKNGFQQILLCAVGVHGCNTKFTKIKMLRDWRIAESKLEKIHGRLACSKCFIYYLIRIII